jgi:hypothetical protein
LERSGVRLLKRQSSYEAIYDSQFPHGQFAQLAGGQVALLLELPHVGRAATEFVGYVLYAHQGRPPVAGGVALDLI